MPLFFPGEEILPNRDEFQGKIGCGSGLAGVPHGNAWEREQPKTRRRGPARLEDRDIDFKNYLITYKNMV